MKSAWLVAAAVLIPLLLFVVFQTGFAAREERRAIEARSLAQAETIIIGADAVVQRSIGAIEALSTIRSLRGGNIAAAYQRSQEIAALNPDWVSVKLRRASDGRELFDLRRPLGRAAPGAGNARVPRGTQVGPVVRDGAGCPCVAIERAAPGPSAGGYVITVLLALKPLVALLPTDRSYYAVTAIVGRAGHFIARSLDQQRRVGTAGSTYLRNAVAAGKEKGIYRGRTLEGVENYTAFVRSHLTGWSAHVALGAKYIDTPARRFLGSLGLAALLSLLLASALIWFALHQLAEGRRVAERGQQTQKLEALGQLTGGIAHDFNNLLTPIIGALDFLLTRGSLDERARRISTGALASAQRAGKLTAQLLTFSRRQKLEIGPVDVGQLFDEIRPLLDQAVGTAHRVDVKLCPTALCVRTDFNQLELALLNLVINARDATPPGGTIQVDAARDESGLKPTIMIRVTDAGEGMSADVQQRALEPFFTTKAGNRGTGLGLAQVFGVMQQSGGSIDIDSRVGEGTTITLRLPECDETPTPRKSASGLLAEAARPAVRALRLLLVDDDAAVRVAIARLFEEEGHLVDSVGDARIALTAIEHVAYDLAIVDFAMPVMDGAELIRAARKLRPTQKFLMVTGYADSDAVTAACPETPTMRKPFDSDALRAKVIDLTS